MDFINDSVNASVMVSSTEYDALHLRHRFGNNPEKLTKNLEDRNYNLEDSSVGIRYAEKYSMPYSYGFKSKKAADIIKDKIYISPFLNESVKDNPLKQKTRNYPMDMTYPKERILNTTIMIPEGYTIDYVPYNRSINNDLFEMEYKIGKSTDRVVVKCRYYFKKTVYHPENYNEIKKYFTEIVRKTNEKIVLVETKVENNLVVVD